jgi:membrane protease YdiL (CAAX protease family)
MARIIDFGSKDESKAHVGDTADPWLELVDLGGAREDQASERGRARDPLEFAVGLTLVFLALWIPKPWQTVVAVLAMVWAGGCILLSEDDRDALGFRFAGSLHSLWLVASALLLCGAALVVAIRLHTFHLPEFDGVPYRSFWTYIAWAFLQEFLLLDFFLLRLLRMLPSRTLAVLTAALLFAVTHLPNPVLAPLTLVWGGISSMIFLRYRNILTPATAHALLGICIAITVPTALDHGMHVGLGYFSFPR